MFKKMVLLALPAAILMVSCSPKPQPESNVLARIGNEKITTEVMQLALESQPTPQEYDPSNKAINTPLFNEIFENQLLRKAAFDYKLDTVSYIRDRWANIEKRIVDKIYRDIVLEQGAELPEQQIQEYYLAHSQYFRKDSNQLKPLTLVRQVIADSILLLTANLDSMYEADKEQYKIQKDSITVIYPPKDSVLGQLRSDYVMRYRNQLRLSLVNRLKAKYNYKLIDLTSPVSAEEGQKYLSSNQDRYLTKPMYQVYQIQAKNKTDLQKLLSKIKSLSDFKTQAFKNDQNTFTQPDSGLIGKIKNGHSLPYGMGMLPELFTQLDSLKNSKDSLKLTGLIENPQTQSWHLFAVTQFFPEEQKPYDRVEKSVLAELAQEKKIEVPDTTTLAVLNGGLIKEADVLLLRKEIPPHYQARYTRDGLVQFLTMWELSWAEAKQTGLLGKPLTQNILTRERDRYYASIYRDSVITRHFGYDSLTLQNTFSQNRKYFLETQDSSGYAPHYNRDIALFLQLDSSDFKIEYHTNTDAYMRDSTLIPYDSAAFPIFQNIRRIQSQLPETAFINKLKEKYKAQIIDSTLGKRKILTPATVFAEAQKLHGERNLADALQLYEQLRKEFPQNESLQDSLCMAIAQLHIEQENFPEALRQYRRLLYLYPQSPNNYKALFMIGFTYAENIKDEKKAVSAFKELISKWPNSDLADDADWMIRNIESGGALMPKLEGDSSEALSDTSKTTPSAPSQENTKQNVDNKKASEPEKVKATSGKKSKPKQTAVEKKSAQP